MRNSFFFTLVLLFGMLCSVEAKQSLVVFLAGEDAMADVTNVAVSNQRGWGQVLPTFLQGNVLVENHAVEGQSAKSYVSEGYWQALLQRARKGNVVLLQFGVNDAVKADSLRYSNIADFEKLLMDMVAAAQKNGCIPFLVTPCAKNTFDINARYYPVFGAYPEAVRRVAQRMNVQVIDLENTTAAWMEEMGQRKAKNYFVENDMYNEKGAVAVAKMAAESLQAMQLKNIGKYINVEGSAEPLYTTSWQQQE